MGHQLLPLAPSLVFTLNPNMPKGLILTGRAQGGILQ